MALCRRSVADRQQVRESCAAALSCTLASTRVLRQRAALPATRCDKEGRMTKPFYRPAMPRTGTSRQRTLS